MSLYLVVFLLGCSVADYTADAVKEKFIREEIVPELKKDVSTLRLKKSVKELTQECAYVKQGKHRVRECK